MKTIREHLNSLPEPYRTEAIMETINQSEENMLSEECESFYRAISDAFVWADSKRGFYYWHNIANKHSIRTVFCEDLIKSTEPQCRQSEPPVPNTRSDSDNEHKTHTVKKPTLINPLFQMWSDPTVSQFMQNFGPPYFTYDHDKF